MSSKVRMAGSSRPKRFKAAMVQAVTAMARAQNGLRIRPEARRITAQAVSSETAASIK